jgi:predicted O-methyltransferase YrrM
MSQIVPDTLERYLAGLNRSSNALLDDIRRSGEDQDIALVSSEVGALLRVLAAAIGATRVLEIGTGIGYSGIWLTGGLPPGGSLFTIEIDPGRARAARENFARAGLQDRANVMIGDAERLVAKVAGPFDLILQDAGNALSTPTLNRLVSLLRPGGLLAIPTTDGVTISVKRA